MHAATILILALAFQDAPAKEPEPTLKPMCEIAKRLDDGIEAFLAGKEMKDAFQNWDVGETSGMAVTKLREDLAKNHVTAARTFAIDLRLFFYSEGKMVYEVQSLIHATPADATLLAFRGRASGSSGKTGVLPEKLAKDAKPFGDAGKDLLRMLKTKKAAELPFANEERASKLMPAAWRAEMKKAMEESKTGAEALRKELNDLKYDEVNVALNEQMFTTLGVEGGVKEGIIRGKLKLTDEGEVTFRLSRYETK